MQVKLARGQGWGQGIRLRKWRMNDVLLTLF